MEIFSPQGVCKNDSTLGLFDPYNVCIFSSNDDSEGPKSKAFGVVDSAYMNWAAKMTVGLDTSLSWVMYKKDDACPGSSGKRFKSNIFKAMESAINKTVMIVGFIKAPWRYEGLNHGKLNYSEMVGFAISGRNHFPCISLVSDRMRKLYCSSSSEPSNAISPESLWKDLKPTISYLAPGELKLVNDALKLAFEAHDGQKRRSGEPYIIHPIEVARILGELELDWESVAAGLLHDTIEDTNVTFERIEKNFGVTVRRIVEGETRVSKLGKLQCKDCDSSVQDVKADDLRQMFLAMTEEVRVIIVKLADRLHNMRTLSHMPQHKQSIIALETLQVFAPLAKLLGMYQIKVLQMSFGLILQIMGDAA